MHILDAILSLLNLWPMKGLMASIVIGIAVLVGTHHFFPDAESLRKIGPFAVGILILGGILWDILYLRKEERMKLEEKKK